MIETIKLIHKEVYYFLILILPLFLISCGTSPSHDIYNTNNKFDRFQTMVTYVKKTIADNPKYQTDQGKKYAQSFQKFIHFLENQVKAKNISQQRAGNILAEVFNQFEDNKYNYKSAKALFYEHKLNYHQMDYSPPGKDTPWPPEEEPLM